MKVYITVHYRDFAFTTLRTVSIYSKIYKRGNSRGPCYLASYNLVSSFLKEVSQLRKPDWQWPVYTRRAGTTSW